MAVRTMVSGGQHHAFIGAGNQQALCHHSLQVERQVHQQLLMGRFGEEVQDALDGLVCKLLACRVEMQIKWPVSE